MQGLEALKHLLESSKQSWRIVSTSPRAPNAVQPFLEISSAHKLHQLPLDLRHPASIRGFARSTESVLGTDAIDVLVLNAAVWKAARAVPDGQLDEDTIVNFFCECASMHCHPCTHSPAAQIYLINLLRSRLKSSSRVVLVSSSLHAKITDACSSSRMLSATS